MARTDRVRQARMRRAVRYLLERQQLANGDQTRIAAYYGVSRQRVHQVVVEERRLLERPGIAWPAATATGETVDG